MKTLKKLIAALLIALFCMSTALASGTTPILYPLYRALLHQSSSCPHIGNSSWSNIPISRIALTGTNQCAAITNGTEIGPNSLPQILPVIHSLDPN